MNELEWFPMESAPRDGTLIVIHDKGSGFPYLAYWSKLFEHWAVPSFEKEEHKNLDGGYSRPRFVFHKLETKMVRWAPIPQITREIILSDREQ